VQLLRTKDGADELGGGFVEGPLEQRTATCHLGTLTLPRDRLPHLERCRRRRPGAQVRQRLAQLDQPGREPREVVLLIGMQAVQSLHGFHISCRLGLRRQTAVEERLLLLRRTRFVQRLHRTRVHGSVFALRVAGEPALDDVADRMTNGQVQLLAVRTILGRHDDRNIHGFPEAPSAPGE
jgi:hypothetical protein